MIQAFRQAPTDLQKRLEGVRTAFLLFNFIAAPLYMLEISLLGHWLDSPSSRWPYLALLLTFILTGLMLLGRRTGWVRTAFLAVMVVMTVTGLAGTFYHLFFNFEGEVDWAFQATTEALEGTRPVLAPLAFTHIGLTGLLCLYRAK